MADNKKGFMLYADLIHTIEKMPDDKAGQLFKIILQYVNDESPTIDDLLLELTFEPIKQQLKRDLVKWEGQLEKRREAGSKGGKARALNAKQTQASPSTTKQSQATLSKSKQTQANQADSDNVTVNDNVTVIDKDIKEKRGDIYIPDLPQTNSLFIEYLAVRKKMKLSNSETVTKRLLNKLYEYSGKGHSMDDVILNAINSNWKDFYEPKGNAVTVVQQSINPIEIFTRVYEQSNRTDYAFLEASKGLSFKEIDSLQKFKDDFEFTLMVKKSQEKLDGKELI